MTKMQERLKHYLNTDPDFKAVYDYTRQRFEAATHLTAHNWQHAYRDTINAIEIGEAEGANMAVVLPAIVMHDIGFLYDGRGSTHGAIGADKLSGYLAEGNIKLDADKQVHIADCIRTHKGNIHGEEPETLEAKVVSDADVLDKLGPIGIYQVTKTFTEFNEPFEVAVKALGRVDRQLCTPTGNKLADPRRPFNQEFVAALKEAYEPYLEEES
jgi:uncharacterized protein